MNSPAAEKIIVALDVPTSDAALRLVEQLRPQIAFFKIGLQLFTAAGPEVVKRVRATGARVFLDLKLHDIPNTVASAVAAAAALDVQMLTLHLSGGRAMIEAAAGARKPGLTILGVTVLTSMDPTSLGETGVSDTLENQVVRLARLASAAGIDGIVASPHEIAALRRELGGKIKLVVPGVRPSWAEPGDQKRIMTPKEAITAGADYLVIGRPITGHANPPDAVERILAEAAT